MFRRFTKKFLPNRLDWMLKKLQKKGGRKVLLGWNRGLGDIPLGLFAIVHRIKEFIPDAEITVLTRSNLIDGFSLLQGVKTLIDPHWKRGVNYSIDPLLKKGFDLVIEHPSPTDWVYWQRGKLIPKLKWSSKHDHLYQKFFLPEGCVGVQVSAETDYGHWRNWPQTRWQELFDRLPNVPILLFGFDQEMKFANPNLIDLRGKTTLFELLSIIKHRVKTLIVPDSGISSMVYYLDEEFPIRHITLWADPNHGILKQNVPSPNTQLKHIPLIAPSKNLAALSVDEVLGVMDKKVLPILLAGGQGTRLGCQGPKGLFELMGKTLFEWFCQKLPKGSPLAIMTSELNHEETVSYFEKNHFFGLDISFFTQEMGPYGPNGNGSLFSSFKNAKLDQKFKDFDRVTVSYVDNPLTHPLDPKLIEKQADIVVQCIERKKEDQMMGALVQREGKFEVVEYTELNPAHHYPYAYSGQLAFDFTFFCQMGEIDLPSHLVEKRIDGKMVQKEEKFIFDVFKYAKKIDPLIVDRKTHFAPIKGPESIESAMKVLERL